MGCSGNGGGLAAGTLSRLAMLADPRRNTWGGAATGIIADHDAADRCRAAARRHPAL